MVNDPGVAADGTATEATPAEEVAAEIRAAGGAAVAEHSSVSTPEGGAAIVQKALDEFGRVDILINNAGILRDKAFHNLEWPNLDAVLDVHLRGAFYVTQPAFRAMRAQAYGRIVLTASNAGILGNFGQANYGAAKMGLVGFMNVLKQEGARVNVKVNTVAPVARTRMTEELLGAVADRLDPEAVAPVVAYFCSEECAVSGDIWSVAGGNVSRFFIGRTPGYFKHPGREGGAHPGGRGRLTSTPSGPRPGTPCRGRCRTNCRRWPRCCSPERRRPGARQERRRVSSRPCPSTPPCAGPPRPGSTPTPTRPPAPSSRPCSTPGTRPPWPTAWGALSPSAPPASAAWWRPAPTA